MTEAIFIRLDADGVGDAIELALLSGECEKAQEIHNSIQRELKTTLKKLNEIRSCKLLMVGSDDILFLIDKADFNINSIEELRKDFWKATKFTLSIGIANSIETAILNLTKAKLKGKNRIELDR